jgi:hypothetical protein
MQLKNPFEYSSIKYAVIVQNILFVILGLSIALSIALLWLTDPIANSSIIWYLWLFIWAGLVSCFSYFQFWWYFSFKAELIYINKVNYMLLKSTVYSGLVIYALTLLQTGQFNIFNTVILVLLTGSYFLFSRFS